MPRHIHFYYFVWENIWDNLGKFKEIEKDLLPSLLHPHNAGQ